MPSTTISDNIEIDIVFEFPQDFSDITFSSENVPDNLVFNIQEPSSIGLEVLTQGLEGAKGDKGEKGDKGDALVYASLTPEEKSEVIAQFDDTISTTSYANIFLNAYLS